MSSSKLLFWAVGGGVILAEPLYKVPYEKFHLFGVGILCQELPILCHFYNIFVPLGQTLHYKSLHVWRLKLTCKSVKKCVQGYTFTHTT